MKKITISRLILFVLAAFVILTGISVSQWSFIGMLAFPVAAGLVWSVDPENIRSIDFREISKRVFISGLFCAVGFSSAITMLTLISDVSIIPGKWMEFILLNVFIVGFFAAFLPGFALNLQLKRSSLA